MNSAKVLSILAVDPGAKTGWCLLLDIGGWHVAACGVASPDDTTWTPMAPKKLDLVVIEKPMIYPNAKARPNDIITLALVAGRYRERFSEAKRVEYVLPREWKGTIDGDVMTKRIEAALVYKDMPAVNAMRKVATGSVQHNAIDAVGIAKWATLQRRLTCAV
jgi:hypothetical protein